MPSSIIVLALSFSFIVLCGAYEYGNYSTTSQVSSCRLPNDTRPISYDIKISTNVHKNDFDFRGLVSIRLLVVNLTDRIVLHAKNLSIEQISLTDLTNNITIDGVESEQNVETSFLTIFSRIKPLSLKPKYEYLLKIAYNSTLSTETKGFYRTSYTDSGDNEIWIATTQFQSTYARRAFPCYDEPQLKTNFILRITHGKNYSALSNMPPNGIPTESEDDTITTTFLETPPMSTYSVAFVVSNFKHISMEKDNVTQRIFYPPENINTGKFALETAAATLHALQEYFNISYPLPKIDHIGVPKSYGQAMENWGLIIYRKEVLLPTNINWDPVNTQTRVITHELAHQWFGNLVTLKWWTYTWLNEGLATHYGNKAIQLIHPEYDIRYYLLATDFGSDWDDISRQVITNYVESESEIGLSFNGATYYKAGRVLEMFEEAFTETTFRKGVSLYLTKFQYSSADEDDFFDALQEAATVDSVPYLKYPGSVKHAMRTWTRQKFYPIVMVTRHYDNGTFTLDQMPSSKKDPTLLWDIPITYVTRNDSTDCIMQEHFFPAMKTMHVDPISLNCTLLSTDWLILNKRATGFYRINYDDKNWKLITESLKKNPKSIPGANRAQLIRDSGFLLLRNKLSASIAFEFFTYLENEDDFLPWNEAVFTLRSIYYQLEDTPGSELFQAFLSKLVHHKFKMLEYEFNENQKRQREFSTNQSPSSDIGMGSIFEFACTVGLKDCQDFCRSKFKDAVRKNKTMDLDKVIEKIILCEGLRIATKEEFQAVFMQFSSTDDNPKRMMFIECLSNSKNIDHIKFLLESILNSNMTYSPEERSYLIENISRNTVALPVLIQFLKDNHKDLANVTSNLWISIAFLRYELRNEMEKQAYLELLDEVKYLGTLKMDMEKQILMKDYPEFHDQQEETVLAWLESFQKNDSSVRGEDEQ